MWMPSQRSPRASGDGHGGHPRSSIFHPNLCSSSLPHHATSQLLVRRPSLPCDQTQAGPQLSFSASPPPVQVGWSAALPSSLHPQHEVSPTIWFPFSWSEICHPLRSGSLNPFPCFSCLPPSAFLC
jgi:hypothetical protein